MTAGQVEDLAAQLSVVLHTDLTFFLSLPLDELPNWTERANNILKASHG